MKKIILLSLLITYVLEGNAQDNLNNSISTSLTRLEQNSQTIYGKFNLKFVAGVEYQRTIKNWNFGVKYEHGFNRINEDCEKCADHFVGTGYMREDNVYLTGNYSFAKLFQSKLIFSSGLSLYYSNLNYAGDFSGGISASGTRIDDTFNTIGLSPNLNITYFPIDRLFISINTNMRFGLSNNYDALSNQTKKGNEFVINAPELRIGVKF